MKNNSVPLHLVKRPQDAAVTHATSQHTILLEYYLSWNRPTKNRSDLLSLTLCTSGHTAKPSREADQPSAFGHHPGSPWLLPPASHRHQATRHSIARGPFCHLHATAKPLCRVQIQDITVRVSGSEVARMLPCNRRDTDSCPLYALVMSHARNTSSSLLQYGAISRTAQTREWTKNSEEQLRATSSYQAPPRRGGDPCHISTHYTIRILSIV